MKVHLAIAITLIFFVNDGFSQHFAGLGAGYGVCFIHSADLERFTSTYNGVNQASLTGPLKGMNNAFGLNLQAGYRYFGHLNKVLMIGYQNLQEKNIGEYANGDLRYLELTWSSGFMEAQLGKNWSNISANGVISIFVNRQISMSSYYKTPGGIVVDKTLNGDYTASHSLVLDLGIAIGLLKKPIYLEGKISYPLLVITNSDILKDSDPAKVQAVTHIFPDDYYAYVAGDPFGGVSSKIDGLKILISAIFVIQFKD